MATIAAYPCLDFSGGVRRDKGQGTLERNELLDARNVHLEETGRVRSRLGSQQLGDTLSGTMENSFFFARVDAGSSPITQLLVNNTASTGVVSRLRGSYLTADLAVGATTVSLNDSGQFSATGTVEIDGDLIAYTGTGAGTLTGVTGVTFAHLSNAPVHQWIALTQSGTAVDGRIGVTYTVLNNICFFGGRVGNIKQYDGATVTDVSGEPSIIFLTNYRDRLYGAGDGGVGTNGDPRRTSFSARGDGTTWTTTSDFFDTEDTDGQYITGYKVNRDRLGIFKTDKIFTYDEIELKKRIEGVGAFNQKVIQEIDGDIFTFCPNGIFITNLSSAKPIGEPVREFWENFVPVYDSLISRVCTNTHAWVDDKSYFLYIGDITSPTSTNDAVLEYDTGIHAWTVHDGGYTDFFHVNTFTGVRFGSTTGRIMRKPVFIGGASGGKVWRLRENRFLNDSSVVIGSDIYIDLRADTGTPIPSRIETQLYDLQQPQFFKKFKNLRVLSESGQWNIEYRVENEQGITQYRTLGSVLAQNKVLPFPSDAQGWRCGFRISGVNINGRQTLNGLIFENTEVAPRP